MSRFARTSAVAVIATAGFAVAASSSATAAGAGGKDGAATYLANQLSSGKGLIQTTFGGQAYPDAGLTADSILALDALHVGGSQAASSTSAFTANVSSYVGTAGEAYVGATAKSIILAVAQGQNPASFGGVNLTSQLKGLEASSGRFMNKSVYGDTSSGLTQALALIAEKKAGITPDAAAVKFTLSHQCADGGFAQNLSGACTSDPDATSFTVQALAAVGGQDAAVKKAANYLKAHQGADGGVTGGIGAEGENSNSTGLAAVAFTLAGDKAAADKAASYIASLQYGCTAPVSLRGAIAYNKTEFGQQNALGAKAPGVGNETRAAAQAVLAYAPTSYAAVTNAGSASTIPVTSCSTTPATTKPSTPVTTKPTTPATTKPSAPASHSSAPVTAKSSSQPTSVSTKPSVSATTMPVATGSSSAPATSAATIPAPAGTTATSTPVVGPKVNTDGSGTNDDAMLALAGAAIVIAGGGAVAFRRR